MKISYSISVKNEICKSNLAANCCRLSELYGFLLFSNTFTKDEIRIKIENENIIARVTLLFRSVFGINPWAFSTGLKSIISISDSEQLALIFKEFGYDFKHFVRLQLNRNILEEHCCHCAFIKGVFLACGNISSPEKNYHLEMKTKYSNLSREIISIMLDLSLKPKLTIRKVQNIIYFKDSSDIEDFLTLISAPISSLAIMETKIEKELINNVNRKVNCETANITKTAYAATNQIHVINKAIKKFGIHFFPDNLHSTIRLRLDNPEMSLAELANISDEKISKAGINHRIRKILELSERI